MIFSFEKAKSIRVVKPTPGRFDMKLLSPFSYHGLQSPLILSSDSPSRHRNVQDYSESHEVDQHGRTSKADKRKRDARDRQKADGHAEILDIVERKVSREAGNAVGRGL